jgi:hypothetical protein
MSDFDAAVTDLADTSSSDSNTLYIILAVQVLLLIERIFTNVFKRVKRCKCSECCSIDMAGSSMSLSDSPTKVRRRSVDAGGSQKAVDNELAPKTSGTRESTQKSSTNDSEGV